LNEAVQYAKENSAPVYLEISKEVLLSNCPDLRGKAVDSPVDKTDLATKARDLISTISALPVEEKIYIYLGEKFAFNPRLIDLIKEFSELTNIPVANSLYIKSAFPEDFPLSLGTYWGPFSKVETVRFIHQASYAIKLGEPNMVRDLGSGFGTWEEKKAIVSYSRASMWMEEIWRFLSII
jgi:thiamine pyrophosphate-dependent acetolactate synthase large subunit-like protein